MTRLTKKELTEFLMATETSDPPENYMGDEQMMADILSKTGYGDALCNLFYKALALLGPDGAAATLWATGFQLGREFEIGRQQRNELSKLVKR